MTANIATPVKMELIKYPISQDKIRIIISVVF